MDLDIDLGKLGRGKSGRGPVLGAKKRNLTEADIKGLRNAKPEQIAPPQTLLNIRNTHHTLAMLLASGRRPEEISQITGYSPSYISMVQKDPAMVNLIDYYKSMNAEQFKEAQASLFERLNSISMIASEELQARLTEKPDDFTNRELMEALSLTADRTGFGPQTKSTNVNVNIDMASRLQRARARSGLSEGGAQSLPAASAPSLSGPQGKVPETITLRADEYEESGE
jgi:hypothetical protein